LAQPSAPLLKFVPGLAFKISLKQVFKILFKLASKISRQGSFARPALKFNRTARFVKFQRPKRRAAATHSSHEAKLSQRICGTKRNIRA
jgi:hypothetical protein